MTSGDGLDGAFTIAGDGVVGRVSEERGFREREHRVGLWADTWGTDGMVRAQLQKEAEGIHWLYVPVRTGLGDAVAALRLEGKSVLVPLGVRPDEFVLQLHREEVDDATLEAAQARSADGVIKEQTAWKDGAFVLTSGDDLVGELRFRGDERPLVSVFDAWWLTPTPEPASVSTDGAELLVRFSVEPSFRGEDALLRVNVPLRKVVAPMGDTPVPEERRFGLRPGGLTEDERSERVSQAKAVAEAMETEFVVKAARDVARIARKPDGTCAPFEALDDAWALMFEGYSVVIEPSVEGCRVGIEPTKVQHGRRYRGQVGGQ